MTMWIKCNECGYEMDASLKDCACEQCAGFDWSKPYSDDSSDEPQLEKPQ